jgi:hypothetical protein
LIIGKKKEFLNADVTTSSQKEGHFLKGPFYAAADLSIFNPSGAHCEVDLLLCIIYLHFGMPFWGRARLDEGNWY